MTGASRAHRLCSDGKSRRIFFADAGMGLAGLALGTLLPQKLVADAVPHFAPKAKRVIWLFMLGGVSHME